MRACLVDGIKRCLLELGFAAVGVTPDLESRLLQQFSGLDDAVEKVQIAAAEQLFFDFGNQCCGLVCAAAKYLATGLTLLGSLLHFSQPLTVLSGGVLLLFDAPLVVREDDALINLLQLSIKSRQGVVEVLR
ncbi:hypothetical protein D3C78_1172370 [compost metagenome]